ncbi:MAG: hypothetical protein AAGA99_13245 [Actinomycetota bacterium]
MDSIKEEAEQLDLWFQSVGSGLDSDIDVDLMTKGGEVGGSVDLTGVVEGDALRPRSSSGVTARAVDT